MKTALLLTANDPQLGASHLMTSTLTDPERGAYEQDVWIISTSLSKDAVSYVKQLGFNSYVSTMDWADNQIQWRRIFPGKTDRVALESFHEYRNKRMSKLIYLEWFEEHGANYDAVAICDNDLYFQQDIRPLFNLAENDQINYAKENYPIVPGSGLWKKDFRYRQQTGNWDYDGGSHEVNIGFIIAKPKVMQELFLEIKNRFRELPPHLIRDYNWHDQDITRTVRADRPDLFTEFPENSILHLCGGGLDIVEEHAPGHFVNRLTGHPPLIVHFGGGAWKEFRSIAPAFQVSAQDIFDNVNQRLATGLRVGVSSASYDNGKRILRVTGWYAAPAETVNLVIASSELGVIGSPSHYFDRPDVAERYPNDSDRTKGWEFFIKLPEMSDGDTLTATIICGGEVKHSQKAIEQI